MTGFGKAAAIAALVGLSQLAAPAASAQPNSLTLDSPAARACLDRNGGYRDSHGGYYDTKAGTYTDSTGGAVDNWKGYTYPDGSYKTGLGDYYDAPKHTFADTAGHKQAVPSQTSNAQMIKALRDNVAANDGYDKDMTRRSMLEAIQRDHPQGCAR